MATYPAYTLFPNGVSAGVSENVYTAKSNTSGFTLAVTDIQSNSASGVAPADVSVLDLTGALGAGANVQLPTAASLLSAFGGVGFSYILRIMNHSAGAFAWTVTTNTGWTLSGTMTIAQNATRDFLVTVNASGTATLQNIGTGTV